MKKITAALAAALVALSIGGSPAAKAAYIGYLYQDGSNVVGTGSGSINTSGLTFLNDTSALTTISPSRGFIQFNNDQTNSVQLYTGFVGPISFGTGANTSPSSVSGGQSVGVDAFANVLFVPDGYVSGTALGISTITFDNKSLSTLGVTVGTYAWTWGTGANADSFTLHIGTSPPSVPEPASLALLGTGLLGLGLVARRKRRRV